MKDDTRGIFDFLTRHQVYLEGVKNWFTDDFARYLRLLAKDLKALILSQSVNRFSDLTRRKLTQLLGQVQKISAKTVGSWGNEFLQEFRKLARIDTTVQRAGFAAKTDAKFSDVTVSSVWRRLSEAINPASGQTYKEGATQVVKRAYDFLQTAFKQSHAKVEDVREFIKTLLGNEADNFKGGTLGKIWKEARAYISTQIQHGTSVVNEVLGSAVSDCFLWCSIIDDITGEICLSLNGKIFRWEDGPTTPAHPHCRSRRIPWGCDDRNSKPPEFDEWVPDQSEDFIQDVFGEDLAGVTKRTAGKIKAYFKSRRVSPLTADEFELKTALMVG